jgi:Uma2 family endonuclease
MNAPDRKKKMTVDEFIPWAMAQPKGRFELVNGEVVPMSPERVLHTETKGLAFAAISQAIKRSGLPCRCLADGATVRIDERTAYEPDGLVYMGPRLPADSIEVPEPVVVVEVLSPGTQGTDTGAKFRGYFSLPSVIHYLIVDAAQRTIVHHRRGEDGQIISEALTTGVLVLDPPGLQVPISEMLPDDADA